MDDWVSRALKRWPNVPALYGWLKLDRRGRWLIKGETIGREQIIDTINRNYACDDRGCWFFQNGPQRGYMELERAPFILHVAGDRESLYTHTRLAANKVAQVFLDEEGGLYLLTEHGPGALLDADLDWALARMFVGGKLIDSARIADALALPSGRITEILLHIADATLPIMRLDDAHVPERLSFVRNPAPQPAS
jgi:hypothetical protein